MFQYFVFRVIRDDDIGAPIEGTGEFVEPADLTPGQTAGSGGY